LQIYQPMAYQLQDDEAEAMLDEGMASGNQQQV